MESWLLHFILCCEATGQNFLATLAGERCMTNMGSIASLHHRLMRTFRAAALVFVGAGVPGANANEHDAPPLLELMQPAPDTTAAVLFCPNCIPQPLLIEAHLYGRARLFNDAPPPSRDIADLDLVAFTPVWTADVKHAPGARCDFPLAVTSHDVKGCLDKLGRVAPWQRIVSRQSPGWPDTFGNSGLFEQESFLAGRSAPQTQETGAQWCLQPIVQWTKTSGIVTADLAFSVEGGLRQCRVNIAADAKKKLPHEVIANHGCYGSAEANIPPGIAIRVTSPGNVCVKIPGEWKCTGSSYPPPCK